MIGASEERTFPEVAAELSRPLLCFLRRYVGDEAAAEDLLQETLLRMARGLAAFEGRASLKTWAFSIAARVAADALREPGRRKLLVELDDEIEPAQEDLAVDERLVIDEMNDCIRQLVDTLPEDYRAALLLHDFEGLSAAQTAEIAGCSVATAKIRIHRARARLRRALEGECDFYRDRASVFRCARKG